MTSTVMTVDDIKAATTHGRTVDQTWMLSVAIGCPFVLGAIVWITTGFGGISPVFVWVGAAVGCLAVFMTSLVLYRCPARTRAVAASLSIAAIAGITFWTLSGGLTAFKLSSNVGAWEQTLAVVSKHPQTGRCIPLHPPTMAGLGAVSQVCPVLNGGYGFGGNPPGKSVFYIPRSTGLTGADECALNVSGPWWVTVPPPPNGGSVDCPAGFHFVTGP